MNQNLKNILVLLALIAGVISIYYFMFAKRTEVVDTTDGGRAVLKTFRFAKVGTAVNVAKDTVPTTKG